jgi:PEP-CTERM motif-containing protein
VFKRPIAPVLVLVLLAVACNRADAGLQLTLKGGRATLSYADGSAGDTDTRSLSVSYTIAEWLFRSSVVSTSSGGGKTKTLTDVSNLSSSEPDTTSTSTTDTDQVLATQDAIALGGLIVGVTSGSLNYSNYFGTSNSSSSTDQLISDVSDGGAGGAVGYTNPFALTPQVELTGGGGGTPGFDGIGTAVVPEPGIIGLLGLGMGLLGLGSWRQRRKLAAAPSP